MLTDTSQTRIAGTLLALQNAGWNIGFKTIASTDFPASLQKRYAALPEDFALFLAMATECASPNGGGRVLTEGDFTDEDGAWPFVTGEYDEAFWKTHCPVALAGETVFSIVAEGEAAGTVVLGRNGAQKQPIAETFTEFLGIVARTAHGQGDNEAISNFCKA